MQVLSTLMITPATVPNGDRGRGLWSGTDGSWRNRRGDLGSYFGGAALGIDTGIDDRSDRRHANHGGIIYVHSAGDGFADANRVADVYDASLEHADDHAGDRSEWDCRRRLWSDFDGNRRDRRGVVVSCFGDVAGRIDTGIGDRCDWRYADDGWNIHVYGAGDGFVDTNRDANLFDDRRYVLNISPASLPNGTVGVVYSQTLTVTNGTGAMSWLVTSGALPAGLTLGAGRE